MGYILAISFGIFVIGLSTIIFIKLLSMFGLLAAITLMAFIIFIVASLSIFENYE